MISKTPTFLTNKKRQPSDIPIKPKIPDYPLTKYAADLFHFYFLLVDYYSTIQLSIFISVKRLQNRQYETVIKKCKKVFFQFGIAKR